MVFLTEYAFCLELELALGYPQSTSTLSCSVVYNHGFSGQAAAEAAHGRKSKSAPTITLQKGSE